MLHRRGLSVPFPSRATWWEGRRRIKHERDAGFPYADNADAVTEAVKNKAARSWHKRQKQRRDSDQNGDCQKVSNFVVQPGIVRRRSNYCHFIASCLARHRVLLKINRRRSCRPGNCVSCKSSLSPQQLKKEDAGSAAPNRRDASYHQSGSVNIMPLQLRYPEEFEWVAHLTSEPGMCAFHSEATT